MSRIHVLERLRQSSAPGTTVHRCIIHLPMPVGNNLRGIDWATAMRGSGRARDTRMVQGLGPDQITAAEAAQVAAGTIIELEMALEIAIADGQIVADRDGTFTALTNAAIVELQGDLTEYGRVEI